MQFPKYKLTHVEQECTFTDHIQHLAAKYRLLLPVLVGAELLMKYHDSEGNASPSNPHDQISRQLRVSVKLSVC